MRNQQGRIFLPGVFGLFLLGISTISYSYDVIRSKQMMEESAKKRPPAESKPETTQSSKTAEGTPGKCICSGGTRIDPRDPNSGYIYHCQCGTLECAVTQGNSSYYQKKLPRPPLSCK